MKSTYIKPEIHYLKMNGKDAIMDYGMGTGSEWADDTPTKRRFDGFNEEELLNQESNEKMSLW